MRKRYLYALREGLVSSGVEVLIIKVKTKGEIIVAIIRQPSVFSWDAIEELGDLDRLRLVIEHLPDEELMQNLEERRRNGRNDYPVRAVWNSVLAGVVFQHKSIESLRRELLRNGQLRQLCGFDVLLAGSAVPGAWVYTRFLKQLMEKQELVDEIFSQLVRQLDGLLPGFGDRLAIDGKAIESHARSNGKDEEPDGRRDRDATWGRKEYTGTREDGSTWTKVVRWFGYKLHLIVDATYELPIGYEVTTAEVPDVKAGHELLDSTMESCDINPSYLMGDKGYDDVKLINKAWLDYGIRPVIDIRNCWKDGDETRAVEGMEDVVHDYRGNVYCTCPQSLVRHQMIYGGYERDRDTHKYVCPALQYGIDCQGMGECQCQRVRIKLDTDRRIFTPLARSSKTFQELYKARTGVERVNGRLDTSFGFEEHYIRGLAKMKLRCGLALIVMLAMAVGHIREGRYEYMRSLVRSA